MKQSLTDKQTYQVSQALRVAAEVYFDDSKRMFAANQTRTAEAFIEQRNAVLALAEIFDCPLSVTVEV